MALSKCSQCQFMPRSGSEQAQSLILSKLFDAGEMTIGRTPQDLSVAAKQIQAGTPFLFDQVEVDAVQSEHRLAKAITPRQLIVDGVKWLAPPIAVVAFALWVWLK